MGSYVPYTRQQQQQMLETIGLKDIEQLYDVVPQEVRIHDLNLPEGKSELEVSSIMKEIASKNVVYQHIYRGAGAYHHYIPSIVKTITGKEEFVTAYTPYQAEISQGVLQSIFEYQTQICELTGMDVSNASVYDGATAAADAVLMCQERKRSTVLISQTSSPQVIEVVKTYCASRNVEVIVLPAKQGLTDLESLKEALNEKTAAVYVQSPNYYGLLEDMDSVVSLTHEAGARVVMGVNPISLGLLKTPAEYGADIAVGDGQPLGLSMAFGGPYLGFMACKKALMRKLPGRIVGQTIDHDGNRCFVLTLQAREQHIRREKASSNICSNQALCAMTASVYLAAMGPKGLKQTAESSAAHAHYLAGKLTEIGFNLRYDNQPYFHEFVTDCPIEPGTLNQKLAEKGILGPLTVDEGILWCCTEMNSKKDIDSLIEIIKEVC